MDWLVPSAGLWPVLPWFAIPTVLVCLIIIAQRGFVFAPSKLVFKASRISPISNAKNKYGRNGLFEFAKSFTKLTLYSVVLGLFLSHHREAIAATLTVEPKLVACRFG